MPKVLIVDDEPDILEFQKAFLVRRKHQVFSASNSKEAIRLFKKESPDIVFCDVRLESYTSGLDILDEIKKINPKAIVYLITGLLDNEIREKGLALGAKEVLIKPMLSKVLEDSIKKALG